MRKLLLLLSLAFAPRLATAQDAKAAVGAEKVTYSRAIPKGLHAFVPRGGKSRFWGATNLKYNGQQVWVHVYDVRKMDSNGSQKSELDLFVLSKSHSLKRLSSTPFDYARSEDYLQEGAFKTVGIETLWLDFQMKKAPILKLTLRSPSSGFGEDGVDIFAVFTLGLKADATIQNFKYGWDSSSDRNSWHSNLDRGDNGLLRVDAVHSSFIGEETTHLDWNGKSFAPTSTEFVKRVE